MKLRINYKKNTANPDWWFFCFFSIVILVPLPCQGQTLEEGDIPERVTVLPVFFVPAGQEEPSEEQIRKLMKHLRIAQISYKHMLKDRDTFEITIPPRIIHGLYNVDHYRLKDRPNKMNYEPLCEVFTQCGWNRFNCPHVLVMVVMNPTEDCPGGGGRPLNPGFNGGGGVVYLPSYGLDRIPWFQYSLQHELGHSFGLVHVSSYGYDQAKSQSIMSYNTELRWKGFSPPKIPAILIPEDQRCLAMNKKVFPKFYFDPHKDIPLDYTMNRGLYRLNPKGEFPGQKEYQIKVETNSGEMDGSRVSNVVHNLIVSKESGFSAGRMWLSGISESGWASIKLTFPVPVSLCKVAVHSQYKGQTHPARAVRIEAKQKEYFVGVCEKPLLSSDAYVSFEKHTSAVWRFSFQAGPSKQTALRGLRFFSSPTNEIFCPHYPYVEPQTLTDSLPELEIDHEGIEDRDD